MYIVVKQISLYPLCTPPIPIYWWVQHEERRVLDIAFEDGDRLDVRPSQVFQDDSKPSRSTCTPWKFNIAPESLHKVCHPNRKAVFQPCIFRGMLVSGRVFEDFWEDPLRPFKIVGAPVIESLSDFGSLNCCSDFVVYQLADGKVSIGSYTC